MARSGSAVCLGGAGVGGSLVYPAYTECGVYPSVGEREAVLFHVHILGTVSNWAVEFF